MHAFNTRKCVNSDEVCINLKDLVDSGRWDISRHYTGGGIFLDITRHKDILNKHNTISIHYIYSFY